MDILGIGFPELILIFIIALMIFGPRRLPEMAAKAGKFVRDLRNMSQGFMTEWQREITAAARLEEIEEARKELEKTRQELQQARLNVASEVSTARKNVNSTLSSVQENLTSTKETTKRQDSSVNLPAEETVEENRIAPPQVKTSSTKPAGETPAVERNVDAGSASPSPIVPDSPQQESTPAKNDHASSGQNAGSTGAEPSSRAEPETPASADESKGLSVSASATLPVTTRNETVND
jgi:Tat protein translocase TatB subunit